MEGSHEGGCACGRVRYRTRGESAKAAICHCRYCQLRTGSAFGVSVYFQDDAVEHLSGALTDYAFRTESDRAFLQRFCPHCGTTVFWNPEVFPGLTGIAGGTFDPPSFWYDIRREVFTRSKAGFVTLTGISESSETSSSHAPKIIEGSALLGYN